MSGVQAVNGGGSASPPPQEDGEVERVARANGWKSREELESAGKGTDRFVDAATFVARGFESPAILRERNQVLTERFGQMERSHKALEVKLDTAVGALQDVTAMTRSAETRAYERARRELREAQQTAVANADTATFQRATTELDELEKTKPAPPPPAPVVTTQAPPQQTPPPAEAAAFFSRNPWYHADPELQEEADIIHTGLLSKRPNLTLGQNLAEVERRMREDVRFADRINGRRTPPAVQQPPEEEDDDRAPSRVTPSSGQAPRRRAGRRTFDTMPQEAKTVYQKYADLLAGKGEPFTKDEYAVTYWGQFPDDGS